MNNCVELDMLTFEDDRCTSLTLDCQESLTRKFIKQAFRLAQEEDDAQHLLQRAYDHYYHELAHFMVRHPTVLIELTLLKPDFSELTPLC